MEGSHNCIINNSTVVPKQQKQRREFAAQAVATEIDRQHEALKYMLSAPEMLHRIEHLQDLVFRFLKLSLDVPIEFLSQESCREVLLEK
jgi:hypothetical protein